MTSNNQSRPDGRCASGLLKSYSAGVHELSGAGAAIKLALLLGGAMISGTAWPALTGSEAAGGSAAATTTTALALGQSVTPGCKNVKATLALSEPAPAAGLVVTLSDTLASASVPAILVVSPGQTGASFMIRTRPVTASETGIVRATVRNTTVSESLTVRPIRVAKMTFLPYSVIRETGTHGTVILECAAEAGPITVDLGSEDARIAYPVASAVVVPQGLQSATFDVRTNWVWETTRVRITATANGFRKGVYVTVLARCCSP